MRLYATLLLALALTVASPAMAQSYEEVIIAQLQRDGYDPIKRHQTWLGKVRIIGIRQGRIREIVLDPSTGEILRDVEVRSSRIPDVSGKGRLRKLSDQEGGHGG